MTRVLLRKIVPSSLRNRFIASFLLFILVPLSIINFVNYRGIETAMREQVSVQNLEQMSGMLSSLQDLLGVSTKTLTLLQQDSTVTSILKSPEPGGSYPALQQKIDMEEKFNGINNSVFISNSYVYYTVIDLKGRVYTSYQPSEALEYTAIAEGAVMQQAIRSGQGGGWQLENSFLSTTSGGRSSDLLSTARIFRDEYMQPIAVAKVSVDYQNWFRNVNRGPESKGNYELFDPQGNLLASAGNGHAFLPDKARISQWEQSGTEAEAGNIISYIRIPELQWILVKSIPTDVLFNKVNGLQRTLFATLLGLMALFILVTWVIATTVTRPLLYLQKKMQAVVKSNMKVRLEETNYSGEIRTFVEAFNMMVRDTDALIQRLKLEERQKEAMRFQMLLSQMNPHFLLNTLNTVKWLALEQGNHTIPEVCESLGKLFEVGVRLDVDLIHLQHELELVRGYVIIQQFRYDRKFDFQMEVAEQLSYALVPKLSLQPLVENCIYHGFAQMEGEGVIIVRAYPGINNNLVIEVQDNGVGMEASSSRVPSTVRKHGIALQNLKERLELLFKERQSIEYVPVDRGTLVRITLPLLISTPYQGGEDGYVDHSAR
ncbi:cache domain-containing sensor histidine kinase [Paenibacillus sedimenti]|uniref:Histidine kinase n=1 Tax=Paenibacillus sedimenti TaxID=2770274 RepID=A0A926QN33_9BACL|nr:sensor histidine kinase [Paenibacillus sedimenti]MBD0384342.1 histidine kinase [Paenibacillus sedimenti]